MTVLAETIGIGSGLLTFLQFAVTSCASLQSLVKDFRGNKKVMRELLKELEALAMVLCNLHQLLDSDPAALPELDSPLKSCARTCQELQTLIIGCTSNSSGALTLAWDWSKLQYKGADIAVMKADLATYKSTISLALGGENLCTVSTTAKVVEDLKELALETKQELQEQLLGFETRLQAFVTPSGSTSDEDAAERDYIQEKMAGTKKCLAILAQISEHMEQDWRNGSKELFATGASRYTQAMTLGELISAPRATSNGIQICKGTLHRVTSELEEHLQQMDNRMQSLSAQRVMTEDGNDAASQRTQETVDNINKCIGICDGAIEQANHPRTNAFNDISAGPDSYQVIVTTLEDLISARRVTAETRATQCLGRMSDASLQQISRDRAFVARPTRGSATEGGNRGEEAPEGTAGERSNRGDIGRETPGEENPGKGNAGVEQSETGFEFQYGLGRKL